MAKFSAQSYIFTDPRFFLSHIDGNKQTLSFVETSESLIRETAFLDGRSLLSHTGRAYEVPISAAIHWQSQFHLVPEGRLILHTSFCGSTLLSNLVQASGEAIVYREPNILVHLANLKALGSYLAKNAETWKLLVQFCYRQISKSWTGDPAVVKPTNWANTLLPDIIESGICKHSVIISSQFEDFLFANLRGGKSRMDYSMQLLNHVINAGHCSRDKVLKIENGAFTPVGRLIRLIHVLHDAQRSLLDRSLPTSDWLDLNDLRGSPATALKTTLKALDLKSDTASIPSPDALVFRQNAKMSNAAFNQEKEAQENLELRRYVSADLEAFYTDLARS